MNNNGEIKPIKSSGCIIKKYLNYVKHNEFSNGWGDLECNGSEVLMEGAKRGDVLDNMFNGGGK